MIILHYASSVHFKKLKKLIFLIITTKKILNINVDIFNNINIFN